MKSAGQKLRPRTLARKGFGGRSSGLICQHVKEQVGLGENLVPFLCAFPLMLFDEFV